MCEGFVASDALLCEDVDMQRLLDKETLDGLSDARFAAIHLFGKKVLCAASRRPGVALTPIHV